MENEKKRVAFNSALIIDDEELELFKSKKALMENNVVAGRVYTETSVRSALHFLTHTTQMPELIFINERMQEFLKNLAHFPFHTTRNCKVFISSYHSLSMKKIVKETEAQHLYLKYIPKPLNVELLFAKK